MDGAVLIRCSCNREMVLALLNCAYKYYGSVDKKYVSKKSKPRFIVLENLQHKSASSLTVAHVDRVCGKRLA